MIIELDTEAVGLGVDTLETPKLSGMCSVTLEAQEANETSLSVGDITGGVGVGHGVWPNPIEGNGTKAYGV